MYTVNLSHYTQSEYLSASLSRKHLAVSTRYNWMSHILIKSHNFQVIVRFVQTVPYNLTTMLWISFFDYHKVRNTTSLNQRLLRRMQRQKYDWRTKIYRCYYGWRFHFKIIINNHVYNTLICSHVCRTRSWWMYLKQLKDILIITNETTINPMFKSIIMITNF